MWRQVLSRAAVRGARGFADAKAPKAAAAAAAAAPAAPAAAAAAEVQLPLKQHGLPARYAGALFVASTKAKVLPTVEKELATVASLTQSNPDFASFLADPSQTKADKLKGINGIMEQGKFSATTKQFFGACRARRSARWRAKTPRPGPDLLCAPCSRAGRERPPGGHGAHCGQVRGADDGVARRGQGHRHLRRGASSGQP